MMARVRMWTAMLALGTAGCFGMPSPMAPVVDGSVGLRIGETDGGGFVRLAIFGKAEAFALPAFLVLLVGTASASLGLGAC